jgi:hypothetical protein
VGAASQESGGDERERAREEGSEVDDESDDVDAVVAGGRTG